MNKMNWKSEFLRMRLLILLNVILLGMCMLILYNTGAIHWEYAGSKKKYTKEELAKYTEERIALQSEDWDRIEDGIHLATGMKFDKNFKYIKASCISCHSPKLITQNRATREGWHQMILWMQETQGLQDLGEAEPFILDYLAEHYAPENTGRRPNLDMESINWYVLELN